METPGRSQRTRVLRIATVVVVATLALQPSHAMQPAAAAPQSQPLKGTAIRGCLSGTKLTQIDPGDITLSLPDTLIVTSIRVIRSQVKALNNHQVEVIGTLRNIPGLEEGLLVVDSDKGKVYIGGGDPRLGEDLAIGRSGPPTIHAHTIRDIAPACSADARHDSTKPRK